MNRRDFLLTTSLLPFSAIPAIGQQIALPDQGNAGKAPQTGFKPYLEVGDYADDRHRVFMFFSYACGYCAQYGPPITEWGKSIPKPIQFVRVPVVTRNRATMAAATAFYVVRELAPQRLDDFDNMAYAANATGIDEQTFPAILARLGIPKDRQLAVINQQITQDRIVRAALLARRYKAAVTPHFGVGGKYATNANFTNGNYNMLVELLNALVTQIAI